MSSEISIVDMQKLAKKRGGECLSEQYVNDSTHLEWKCERGHTWRATPSNIKQKKWCPKCAIERRAASRRKSIEELQEIARSRGGQCLSENYKGTHKPHEWECAYGHHWKASPANIKSRGSWCPKCSRLDGQKHRRLGIEKMQDVAREKGGVCISNHYNNINRKLWWRCANGHRWDATPANILSGKWCPKCSIQKRRLSIDVFKRLAEEHGGKCLSDNYMRLTQKLRWRCSEGHEWEAMASSVKNTGTWCAKCAAKNRYQNQQN